jgi:hypothetical protein
MEYIILNKRATVLKVLNILPDKKKEVLLYFQRDSLFPARLVEHGLNRKTQNILHPLYDKFVFQYKIS